MCLAYWYPALQDASTASPTARACLCLAVLCVQSCSVLRDPLFNECRMGRLVAGGEGRTREEGVSGDEEGMGKSMKMEGGGEGWA